MKNLLKLLGLFCICHPLYATTIAPYQTGKSPPKVQPTEQPPRLELSLLLGASYIPNGLDGKKLELLPYEIGDYADTFTDQSDAWAFSWGLDAKYRFKFMGTSLQNYVFDSVAAGLDIIQITSFDQTGHVLQFKMPDFENYSYTLNIKNTRVMADLDMAFHPIGEHIFPFIETGIGIATTAVSYSSSPISPVDGPEFKIPQKSTLSFAFQLGAGFKYVINQHMNVSLRYLYADMGSVDTSTSGNTATLEKPLNVDLSSQTVLFGFTYVR